MSMKCKVSFNRTQGTLILTFFMIVKGVRVKKEIIFKTSEHFLYTVQSKNILCFFIFYLRVPIFCSNEARIDY